MLRIKDRRNAIFMSQTQLSKVTGLSQAYICELEKGKRLPSLKSLLKLADALGCTIDDLLVKRAG